MRPATKAGVTEPLLEEIVTESPDERPTAAVRPNTHKVDSQPSTNYSAADVADHFHNASASTTLHARVGFTPFSVASQNDVGIGMGRSTSIAASTGSTPSSSLQKETVLGGEANVHQPEHQENRTTGDTSPEPEPEPPEPAALVKNQSDDGEEESEVEPVAVGPTWWQRHMWRIIFFCLSGALVATGILIQTLANHQETSARVHQLYRWFYFLAMIWPTWMGIVVITSWVFWFVEWLFFREALYYLATIMQPARWMLLFAVLLAEYYIIFDHLWCGKGGRLCNIEEYRKAMYIWGRVLIILLLFASANFLKALLAKLLSSYFYRAAHLMKVEEALEKEYMLIVLSQDRDTLVAKRDEANARLLSRMSRPFGLGRKSPQQVKVALQIDEVEQKVTLLLRAVSRQLTDKLPDGTPLLRNPIVEMAAGPEEQPPDGPLLRHSRDGKPVGSQKPTRPPTPRSAPAQRPNLPYEHNPVEMRSRAVSVAPGLAELTAGVAVPNMEGSRRGTRDGSDLPEAKHGGTPTRAQSTASQLQQEFEVPVDPTAGQARQKGIMHACCGCLRAMATWPATLRRRRQTAQSPTGSPVNAPGANAVLGKGASFQGKDFHDLASLVDQAGTANKDAVESATGPQSTPARRHAHLVTMRRALHAKTFTRLLRDARQLSEAEEGAKIKEAHDFGRDLYFNVCSDYSRGHITLEDLRLFFPGGDSAEKAQKVLDMNGDGKITKREMKDSVAAIYKGRKNLAATLQDTDNVVGSLETCLGFVLYVVVAIVALSLFNINIWKGWTTFSTVLLGLSFVFGNSVRNLFESALFILAEHPYDVGDLLRLDDQMWRVHKFDLMYTVLNKTSGEKVYFANTVMMTKQIQNFTTSTALKSDSAVLRLDITTPASILTDMKAVMEKHIAANRTEFSDSPPSVQFSALMDPCKVELSMSWQYSFRADEPGRSGNVKSALLAAIITRLNELECRHSLNHYVPDGVRLKQE